MADVTGPSFMNDPGPRPVPHGQICDVCDVAPAVHRIVGERDSFGIEWLDCCQPCLDKIREEEREQLVTCHDCKSLVNRGGTIAWRWYDFYAAQGDEPIIICKSCTQQPKHKERVARNTRDAQSDCAGTHNFDCDCGETQ